MSEGAIAKFMSKVHVSESGCWNWTGANKGNGYGHTRQGPAHRRAYQLFVGAIPKGHDVCHKCDNRPCVNPDHLFTGTRKQNMQDCVAKGRIAKGDRLNARKGENGPSAKLTWRQVKEIRLSKEKSKVIAAKYGVTSDNVNKIKSFKTWKEV